MAGEQAVRDALELQPEQSIHEIGVFRAPKPEVESREYTAGAQDGEEGLDGDELVALGLGRNVFDAPEVGAVLRQGHARRLAADPRVLILEDISEPEITKGPVTALSKRRWVVDTRGDEPAVMLTRAVSGSRVAIWGAHGELRLFSLDAPGF